MKLTDKVFLYAHTDDECFYVGLGHQGASKRKGQNYVPNEYRPFQCCPTKLERTTKVPKMTAQKIGHKNDEKNEGTFKFAQKQDKKPAPTPSVPTHSSPLKRAEKKPLPKFTPVKTAKKEEKPISKGTSSSNKAAKKPEKEPKKALAKKDKKQQPNQKGLFGIGNYIWW